MSEEIRPVCGIIRPIAEIDGCGPEHWSEVHAIICAAIEEAGFAPKLVSEAEDGGVIQGRIVKNLYGNPVVVCDVSGKNPNVMLELGMRLAFDKPTVVIKDDATTYSFDTSPIEHIGYRRDLRFASIETFKTALAAKIAGSVSAVSQQGYQSFLQHFGPIKVARLETESVPAQDLILDELRELRSAVAALRNRALHQPVLSEPADGLTFDVSTIPQKSIEAALHTVRTHPQVLSAQTVHSSDGSVVRFMAMVNPGTAKYLEQLRSSINLALDFYRPAKRRPANTES